MRFMVIVKSNEDSEAGALPDEKMLSEMGAFNEELIKANVMLAGDGLKASSYGAKITLAGKRTRVIDGPFAEAKELVGGFWLLQAKSKAEVIDWMKRAPFKDGTLEIRPLIEPADLGIDPADFPQAEAKPPARKPGTQRFILMLKADKLTESGAKPTKELLSEMGGFMQELAESGTLLGGDGLKATAAATRIFFSDGKPRLVDGPFTESKELIAGYSTVQVKDKAEAIALGTRMLEIHVRGTGQDSGALEVRAFHETEDFPVDPAEKPDGWRKKEIEFRERQSH